MADDRLPDQETIQLMLRLPDIFRENIRLDFGKGQYVRFGSVMEWWQRQDFDAVDPCLQFLAGLSDQFPKYQRFFRQRARGHSKTSDLALDRTYLLAASRKPLDGYAVAEDKDQAKLIFQQMIKIGAANPWLKGYLTYGNNVVRNIHTGAKMTVLSRDKNSSWGITPDFVDCDEFSHWSQEDYWNSIFSSFGKRADAGCMLTINCNAGQGLDWKYNVMVNAVHDPRWYCNIHRGPQASWVTEETLAEQKRILPDSEFQRLWMNVWQTTGGDFVTLAEADECVDKNLKYNDRPPHGGDLPYVASLDFAPKHDYTVGCVVHQESDDIVVDKMDVIVPNANRPTRVAWAEEWIRNTNRAFRGNVVFCVDEYQMLGSIEKLKSEGVEIVAFEFGSGIGNFRMGICLRQLIMNQRVRWYPGCGEIQNEQRKRADGTLERDDLSSELASLIIEPRSGGRWRFNHLQDGIHHDDRSYALASACVTLIDLSGGFDAWEISNGGWSDSRSLLGSLSSRTID